MDEFYRSLLSGMLLVILLNSPSFEAEASLLPADGPRRRALLIAGLLPEENFLHEDSGDEVDAVVVPIPRSIHVQLNVTGLGDMGQFVFGKSFVQQFRDDREGLRREVAASLLFSLSAVQSIEEFSQKLHRHLEWLIEHEHGACVLTPLQRQKLQRSGEGEIRHLIETADRLHKEIIAAYQIGNAVVEISMSQYEEAYQINAHHNPAFGPDSLFVKVRERVLTSSQKALSGAAAQLRAAGASCHSRGNNLGICEVRFSHRTVPHHLLQLLSEFPYLDTVSFHSTRITGDDLGEIARLERLTTLKFQRSIISDEALRQLSLFPNLETLDLAQTNVTDAGLEHLKLLKRLKTVDLTSAGVTEAGIERLKLEIPGLQITR